MVYQKREPEKVYQRGTPSAGGVLEELVVVIADKMREKYEAAQDSSHTARESTLEILDMVREAIAIMLIERMPVPKAPAPANAILEKYWERIPPLPRKIKVCLQQGVRNGLEEGLLRKSYGDPTLIEEALQIFCREAGLNSEIDIELVNWAKINPSPGDALAGVPGLAIPADFGEFYLDETYQLRVVEREVERIVEAMQENDLIILGGHSHGNNLTMLILARLLERGSIQRYRARGGKILWLGLAPAFTGVGPMIFQAVGNALDKDCQFIFEADQIRETIRKSCDFAFFLRGKWDILSGSFGLEERGEKWQSTTFAGLRRALKAVLTVGVGDHMDVWTRDELKEGVLAAMETLYREAIAERNNQKEANDAVFSGDLPSEVFPAAK